MGRGNAPWFVRQVLLRKFFAVLLTTTFVISPFSAFAQESSDTPAVTPEAPVMDTGSSTTTPPPEPAPEFSTPGVEPSPSPEPPSDTGSPSPADTDTGGTSATTPNTEPTDTTD